MFNEIKRNINVIQVREVGSIDVQIFKDKFGEIQTDKVIITDERLEHIKNHHSRDIELFNEYVHSCITTPEMLYYD